MSTLLADLFAAYKTEYKKFPKDANPTAALLGCILESYQEARYQSYSIMIQNLFIKIIPKLQITFPGDFNEEVQKIALDSWTVIDSGNLDLFLNIFQIKQLINPKDMFLKIEKYLRGKHQMGIAAEYIAILNLYDAFDLKEIVKNLSKERDGGSVIVKLVAKDPELQKFAVMKCVENKNAKNGGEIVKQYSLNPYDFPGLIPALQTSAIRFHMNEATWMQIEEKFCDDKSILGIIVDEFLYKNKVDEALSIVRRHKLYEGDCLIPQVQKKVAPYFENPPKKTFNYLENELFTCDDYAPTQELLRIEPPGTFMHLKDLGCDPKNDLIYIDNLDSVEFDLAVKDIFSSEAIGFDTEFKFNLTRFDVSGTALMQIATRNKAYLIDSLKVSETPKYNQFVKELVSNPKIKIVGHTLSADLSKLRQTGDNDKTLEIAGEVDLAKIYKTIYPEKSKYGLATICEDLLGKPMTKYEQISNWHNRPLRKTQMHYAAMDVVVCLKLLDKFKEIAQSQGTTIEEILEAHTKSVKNKKPKDSYTEEQDDEVEEDVEDETPNEPENNISHTAQTNHKEEEKKSEVPKDKEAKEKLPSQAKSSKNNSVTSNGQGSLSELIDSLICGSDSQDSLQTLNEYVKQNRPIFENLDAEIIKSINKEQERLKKTATDSNNPLSILIDRILTIYYQAKTKEYHSMVVNIFIKLPQKLKLAYPNSFDDSVKQVAIKHWKNIDSLNLGTFLHTFEIRSLIDSKEKIPQIKELLNDQKTIPTAANYISVLGLYDQFDIDGIVKSLATDKEWLTPLTNLIRNFPDLQKKAIQYCIEGRNAKNASEILTTFKLNPHNFPDLIAELQKSSLRFHMGEGTWIQLEERFFQTPDVLGFIIEEFLKKDWLNEALSIIKRRNLLEGDYLKTSVKKEVEPYFTVPPTKTWTYLENELFTKDDLAPTHEILGLADPNTYLHLSDVGIDVKKDLIFIDDAESEAFETAVKDILSSNAIGFDTEFKFNLTKFDVHGTGLMQIATATKAYLIDSMKISNTPKYNQFVTELVSHPKIQIVGHTLSADISKLRETQKKNDQQDKGGLQMAGEMDISKIWRLLHPGKKYSLAAICEEVLKKPMSKYDQMSNWHNRPLRKAQMHYAALDAVVVLVLFEKLKEEIHSRGAEVEEFIRLKGNTKPVQKRGPRGGSKKNIEEAKQEEGHELKKSQRNERPRVKRASKTDEKKPEEKVQIKKEKVQKPANKQHHEEEKSKENGAKNNNSDVHYEIQYVAKEEKKPDTHKKRNSKDHNGEAVKRTGSKAHYETQYVVKSENPGNN
jgi:ribonuclease D